MDLRQLITQYILYAVSDEELQQEFQLTEDEVVGLSDIDLLELYDKVMYEPTN